MKDLNAKELEVLEAAVQAIEDENCEFANSRDVRPIGYSVEQVKGYLSQLVQKGYISIEQGGGAVYNGQLWANKKLEEAYPELAHNIWIAEY